MPDLAFRSATSGGDTSFSTGTIVATVPAGMVQDDNDTILFGASAIAPTPAPTHTTPAGYALAGTFTYTASGGAVNSRISVFQRIAPATPVAASLVAGAPSALAFLRLAHDNPDLTGALGQITFGAWSGTAPTAGSMTTVRARSLLLMFVTQGLAQGCTPPAGMEERVDNATYALSGHDVIQVSAGASGAKAASVSSSTDGAWAFLELYSDPTVTPNIIGVSDSTPANGASLTVTGTDFGASQGTQQLRMGGAVQSITSWSDTSIVVSALSRSTNPYGPLDIEVWDGGVPTSNAFGVSLEPQAGWAYVNLGTPNATAANRITAPADLTSGDQLAYETVGSTVIINADATFVAYGDTSEFDVEAWTPVDGWGTVGTQTITAPQVLEPTSTISAGTWVSALGGSLHAALSETTPDDASYVYTETPGDFFEIAVDVGVDPATGYGHVPGYRIAGNGTSGMLVEVRQGATVIASFTHDPAPADWQTFFQVLTPTQADAITDYTALRLRFTEV